MFTRHSFRYSDQIGETVGDSVLLHWCRYIAKFVLSFRSAVATAQSPFAARHVGMAVAEVDASTDVESDAFWAKLCRHKGSFTVQCQDLSTHVVRWDPPPNRSSAAGVIGYYTHEAKCSEGPSIRMDGYHNRIHVCRQTPCIADYHPSK